jgi:hypothetical protein
MTTFTKFEAALLAILLLSGCELDSPYGQLGGADQTDSYLPGEENEEGRDIFEEIMSSFSGVWYSHYAGIGRLDGYRIGKWEDFDDLVRNSGKISLFPNFKPETYHGNPFADDDYFIFYDDTVYGQADDTKPAQESWGFGYIGIVRAVNVFNGDVNRGAVIIEYMEGCVPTWDDDLADGSHPFFGIYYRVLGNNTVQMANAVDLAAMYAKKKYYTETAHLNEAIEKNNVESEAEFIAWGVVIPQNREGR